MANLREEVPAEFADDERWYRFFTRTTLMVLVIVILYVYLLTKLFGLIGLEALGLIAGIATGSIVFIIFNIKIPRSDTLHGAGASLSSIIYRAASQKRNGKLMSRYPD